MIVPLAGMATGAIISIAFFKTVRHFIDRKLSRGGGDAELQGEIADLHARIEALEQDQGRVEELENRLDFAERLLARANEGGVQNLPGGG
jgi:hypothetical protein